MAILFNPNTNPKIWYLFEGLLITVFFCSPAISATIVKPVYKIKLNDTGIITCSNLTKKNLPCPQKTNPGQDAQYGRDKTANNNSDGHAGFSFTKISSTGKVLLASAKTWNCVKDNVTGLMWEGKTNDGRLHDMDWTYSWYEPNNKINGGFAGIQNGGLCSTKKDCDTYAYVKAVNKAGWCGHKDWRMPTVEELSSLTSFNREEPALDITYFPETNIDIFWSSTPYFVSFFSFNNYAWYVNFFRGHENYQINAYDYQIRLVRNGQ
ncbi:DUF1566 domain-containing protein [Crenothrix polyspora]|uniref:Lcl C-terminal domain-containing protein n=1 Tax=Crenothrix polyspora TaxID=360316 RepID=A0A1R4H9J1_9GAMM|nr:DUF1566 domain-containing protein [Crenothrix polyspora]SJM92905.1 conserved hypothetical protein [Crenothrix polyspora]